MDESGGVLGVREGKVGGGVEATLEDGERGGAAFGGGGEDSRVAG